MLRVAVMFLLLSVSVSASTLPGLRSFVPNSGQWPEQVLYGAVSGDVLVFVTKTGMLLDQRALSTSGKNAHHTVSLDVIGSRGSSNVLTKRSASTPPVIIARAGLLTNPAECASSVTVRNVVPGIHLEYVWDGDQIRYNVLVDKGTQLPNPLFKVRGSDNVTPNSAGFTFKTSLGSISMSGLAAFTTSEAYPRAVLPVANARSIGFVVADRHTDENLTVDPIVSAYAVNGAGNQEITSMAIDRQGNVVVAGWTTSFDIAAPGDGAFPAGAAGTDGFIACLTPDLKTVIAFTYIAGDSNEVVRSLAISPTGDIWVTGETNSTNIPVSALKGGKFSGNLDGFVLRLSSDLKRVLAGKYISGNREDRPLGIACNAQGDAFVCGQTKSTSGMPTAQGYDQTNGGGWDAFALVIDRTGADVLIFSYFGGLADDAFTTVVADNNGSIVLGGWTSSNDFETFPIKTRVWVPDDSRYEGGYWQETGSNPFDVDYNGGSTDIVVVKFTSNGLLTFSTYFGGSGEDMPSRILASSDGQIILVGTTRSNNLPVPEGTASTFSGRSDAFVFGLSSDGLRLRSLMYYGGDGEDMAGDASWDSQGNVIITGSSTSTNLTQTGAGTSAVSMGSEDGFLAILGPSEIRYSTLFGWTRSDIPKAIARDSRGDCFIAGRTSSNLPGRTVGGAHDALIAKWAFGTLAIRRPTAGVQFCTGSTVVISWVSVEVPVTATYAVEYSADNGLTWTVASSGIMTTSYTWTVPATRPESGKVLLRVVSSHGHIALATGAFTVESAPVFVTQPQSVTACPNTRIELDPDVDATNATYQWTKNGQDIAGATQRVLVIASARSEDAGTYRLVATTSCKTVTSNDAVVAVSAQPIITMQPVSANVQVGGTINLSVEASGPSLTYQWQHNSVAIDGATEATYVITNASSQHEGAYRCVVNSACGTSTSSVATITVGTTSVSETEMLARSATISPQPATSVLRVVFNHPQTRANRIDLVSVSGVTVLQLLTTSGAPHMDLDVSSLANGVYALRIGGISVPSVVMIAR